jgi:hypothetical protein
MPDIFGELARDWDHLEHAATSHMPDVSTWFSRNPYAPTIEPATPAAPDAPEDPMNIAELEADARALVAKFETVDHDALAKLEAIKGNPDAMNVFGELARLAGVPGLPAGILNGAALVLQAIAP